MDKTIATSLAIKGAKGKLSAVLQKTAVDAGKKCPLVIIMHGFGGNKDGKLLTMIADALEELGIASIRFDFNGHGESEGAFEDMTVLNEIEDARQVYNYARSLDFVNTISLLGHSQGGVVSSMLAGELGKKDIQSVVLMAPAAVLREDAIRGCTMGVLYDPLNPPEYVELPGGLHLGREYIKAAFSLPIFETARNYAGPVCLIHGTGDCVVPYTYSKFYEMIYKKSELHILDGFDHGFSQDQSAATNRAVDFLIKYTK